jgi:two-component system, NarL family, invasion response regulator UvrY
VIRRLKAGAAGVRILVISMHDNSIDMARALQAGAAGYVSKNAPPDQILNKIKRADDDNTYIEHEIAQQVAQSKLAASPRPLSHLWPRYIEILRLLGDGRSLLQIADAIGVCYKTVANHCTRLKAKLGAARTVDLVRIAISHGISSGGA